MNHWINDHWAVLAFVAAVAIPSLITGLTVYDQTGSLIKAVIALLSFVSNQNSPGTFKLPFTRPKPPEKP